MPASLARSHDSSAVGHQYICIEICIERPDDRARCANRASNEEVDPVARNEPLATRDAHVGAQANDPFMACRILCRKAAEDADLNCCAVIDLRAVEPGEDGVRPHDTRKVDCVDLIGGGATFGIGIYAIANLKDAPAGLWVTFGLKLLSVTGYKIMMVVMVSYLMKDCGMSDSDDSPTDDDGGDDGHGFQKARAALNTSSTTCSSTPWPTTAAAGCPFTSSGRSA